MSATKKPKGMAFEEAMESLEGMIQKMESGNLPLEESLHMFEEGMKLARFCEQKLTEAESRVETLMKNQADLPPSDTDAL